MPMCPICQTEFSPRWARSAKKPPQIYCSKKCAAGVNSIKSRGISGRRGLNRFKTGKLINAEGYVRVLTRDHPWPRKYHYMFEHVMVMEQLIGRRLLANEIVHHKDHNRANNGPENLELLTRSEHQRLHWLERKK